MGTGAFGRRRVPRRCGRARQRRARPVSRRGAARLALFVDTSALYAVVAADDPNHEQAAAVFPTLRGQDAVTHNYVVLESIALVHGRHGHAAARRLIGDLLPAFRVLWVDEDVHSAATSAFMAARRSSVSLVDRVSFELMRRERIDTAFAFDRDFGREGFSRLP